MVSFTLRPLYPQGKSPLYPLDRRPGEHQSRSGHGGEEKNSQPRWESTPRTPIVQSVARRVASMRIMKFYLDVDLKWTRCPKGLPSYMWNQIKKLISK